MKYSPLGICRLLLAAFGSCFLLGLAQTAHGAVPLYKTGFETSGSTSGLLFTTSSIAGQHGWTVKSGTATLNTTGGSSGTCCMQLSNNPVGSAELALSMQRQAVLALGVSSPNS